MYTYTVELTLQVEVNANYIPNFAVEGTENWFIFGLYNLYTLESIKFKSNLGNKVMEIPIKDLISVSIK